MTRKKKGEKEKRFLIEKKTKKEKIFFGKVLKFRRNLNCPLP